MAVFASTNPENLVRTLGSKWHGSYSVASCPVCQPQKRKDQNALPYAKLGRAVRYRASDLVAYIERNTVKAEDGRTA
jgi:hypothetical protein